MLLSGRISKDAIPARAFLSEAHRSQLYDDKMPFTCLPLPKYVTSNWGECRSESGSVSNHGCNEIFRAHDVLGMGPCLNEALFREPGILTGLLLEKHLSAVWWATRCRISAYRSPR